MSEQIRAVSIFPSPAHRDGMLWLLTVRMDERDRREHLRSRLRQPGYLRPLSANRVHDVDLVLDETIPAVPHPDFKGRLLCIAHATSPALSLVGEKVLVELG